MRRYIVFILLLFSIDSFAQQLDVGWDFTVKPGTEKWNNLVTEQERIDAVQVPEDVLENMTAEELAITCINFPLFGDYTAFNTPQQGMNVMFDKFNFYKYVRNKKGIGKIFIKIYKDAYTEGWNQYKSILDSDFWTIKLEYIEYLMAQDFVISDLDEQDKKELLIIVKDKINKKLSSDSFNSLQGISSSYYLIAHILDTNSILQNDNIIQDFLKTGMLTDIKVFENIEESFKQYINKTKS